MATLDRSRQSLVYGSAGQRREDLPSITVTDPGDFAARLLHAGTLGFGEAFIEGSWRGGDGTGSLREETDEVVDWLAVYADKLAAREPAASFAGRLGWRWRLPRAVTNTKDGSRRNVALHYDLPPEFFRLFLDPGLTYSCADFRRANSLEAAQLHKINGLLDLAEVRSGCRLLDVGCGWGSLLAEAAARGAESTGITVSRRQYEYCLSRFGGATGFGAASVLLEDYRDHSGEYDSITSVEMIEAVGSAYWVGFFRKLGSLLASDGTIALQVITFPDGRMKRSIGNYSWVDRYIFPGGELTSIEEIDRILQRHTGLELTETRRLSSSYARTLRDWRHQFCARLEDVQKLGFDERFIRVWALYLAYFEAGFRVRYLDVWQCQLRPKRPISTSGLQLY
ncbi:class I SAM-dependent methyltransferase [Micromonospora narathiwatensis]|uniref:Cyclopropane-fatty-acyl-phospholipid synthase n=1 Tax=Micromonospora narathiwatensis TaxID=299146 RepID=A0A1A8Z981_9ACTN|nr:class I SAM-dependent methyltransferase [Micromonospora narathiwatensis]SBT40414.1 cyclopropane-fatty-acyl-phospholipid synthase [Micromonospora narathiwatensis]